MLRTQFSGSLPGLYLSFVENKNPVPGSHFIDQVGRPQYAGFVFFTERMDLIDKTVTRAGVETDGWLVQQ